MKVWMWQRLWKFERGDVVFTELSERENDKSLHREPFHCASVYSWRWLCPKPNIVLVDRKHLGDME